MISVSDLYPVPHTLSSVLLLCKILGERVETYRSGIFPQKFLPRVTPVVIVVAIPGDEKRNKIQLSTEIWHSLICCKGRNVDSPSGSETPPTRPTHISFFFYHNHKPIEAFFTALPFTLQAIFNQIN